MSRHCLAVAVALATMGGASVAQAASVVQTRTYEFSLTEAIPALALVYGNDTSFNGNGSVSFNRFDPTLGTLTQVKLQIEMTISGELEIGSTTPPPTAIVSQAYPTLTFGGAAEAGPLLAEVDFGSYEIGVDGVIVDDVLTINETGDGEDATSDPTDLAFFVGNGGFDAQVWASLLVEYLQTQIGNGDNLVASGQLQLTYNYRGTQPVVPTPAALPLGVALLGGVLLCRSRNG